MNQKKPYILISNDDGYQAPGIRQLVDALREDYDLLVCAPESGRSGYACAFSAVPPLTLTRRDSMGPGVEVWSCSGTPVDCVKMAMGQIRPDQQPDLIIGGINHGANNTINVHYSGTAGVAIEGTMKYVPSLAFSSCDWNPAADLTPLVPYIRQIVAQTLNHGLPRGIFLNVNFPVGTDFKGIKICRMTWGRWVNETVKRAHPRGHYYYWMVGQYVNDEPEAQDSDEWAVNNGYVAITPTDIDVTAYEFFDQLKSWSLDAPQS